MSVRIGVVLFLFLASTAVILAGAATPGKAATTTTVDCTTNPGALAVALAGASDGDTLAIQGTCAGTFEIAHSLTLAGSGGAALDGQGGGTVLKVDSGFTVTVDSLTITGGSGLVAGISNAGELTLTDTAVTANHATVGQFQNGVGGILNQQGGSVALTSSTVSGNSASATAPFDTAVGGILNACCGSSVTVTNSTVSGNSGNSPSDAFGGILNSAPASVVTLTNSTVSGNTASAAGGTAAFATAVAGASNSGGTLTITYSTVSGNTVSEPNGGFLPPVAGISNFFGGTLTARSALVAGQSGGPNCSGFASSSDGGYNLDDGASCGFDMANHSLSNTDPLLDPAGLQDNGGPTETIALLPGSPAVDAIPASTNGCGTTTATDQRGISRPQGPGCDMGALELMPEGADLSIGNTATPSPVLSGGRLTYTLTVTNHGPQSATGVDVTDSLPLSVHFDSVTSAKGTCTRTSTTSPKPKDGSVTCNLGTLGSGASAAITVVVTATTPGTVTNTAMVAGDKHDPNPANNSATAVTRVIGT